MQRPDKRRLPPGPPGKVFSPGKKPLSREDKLVIVVAYAVGIVSACAWLALYVSNMRYL